jgi:hypothetical protein
MKINLKHAVLLDEKLNRQIEDKNMNAQKLNAASPTFKKQLRLAVVHAPDNVEKVAPPERLKKFKASSFGTGLCCDWFNDDSWSPSAYTDAECNRTILSAPVESLTEEQYRKFSRVILPTPDGLCEGFSGKAMPSLDHIKRNFSFPRYIASVVCWRYQVRLNKN